MFWLRDVGDLIRRYDQRRKSTVKLGQTQEAGDPRQLILVSLDTRSPSGAADETRAINATGQFISAGVRVQVRFDRPARAVIEGIVGDVSGDDRGAWTPEWAVLAGTTPAIGSGELVGRYQIIEGRFFYEMVLVGAADTVWGSGGNAWLLGFPAGIAPPSNPAVSAVVNRPSICTWRAFDASANGGLGQGYFGFGEIATHAVLYTQASTSAAVSGISNSVPFTWTTNDWLLVSGDMPLART